MADLVTHAAVTLLTGRGARLAGPRLGWFLSGAFMPDFVARAPTILLGKLVGPVLPPGDYSQAAFAFSSLHTPFGFALVAAALVLALPDSLIRPLARRTAWALLVSGALLHIAVDLLQKQYSMPPVLLHPVSLWGPDIGFLGTEDSLYSWPILLPCVALVEWRVRTQRGATPKDRPARED